MCVCARLLDLVITCACVRTFECLSDVYVLFCTILYVCLLYLKWLIK